MAPTKPSDDKRNALIAAAATAFARDGFAAARIGDIAEAAGVGKGTVYEYFASKEELLIACCLTRCDNDRAAIRGLMAQRLPEMAGLIPDSPDAELPPVPARPDSDRVLREFLCTGLSHLLAMPDQESRLFMEMMTLLRERPDLRAQVQERINGVIRMWEAIIVRLLESGIASGRFRPHADLPALARMLTAIVDGLLLQRIWRHDIAPAELAVRITDAFIATLRKD